MQLELLLEVHCYWPPLGLSGFNQYCSVSTDCTATAQYDIACYSMLKRVGWTGIFFVRCNDATLLRALISDIFLIHHPKNPDQHTQLVLQKSRVQISRRYLLHQNLRICSFMFWNYASSCVSCCGERKKQMNIEQNFYKISIQLQVSTLQRHHQVIFRTF